MRLWLVHWSALIPSLFFVVVCFARASPETAVKNTYYAALRRQKRRAAAVARGELTPDLLLHDSELSSDVLSVSSIPSVDSDASSSRGDGVRKRPAGRSTSVGAAPVAKHSQSPAAGAHPRVATLSRDRPRAPSPLRRTSKRKESASPPRSPPNPVRRARGPKRRSSLADIASLRAAAAAAAAARSPVVAGAGRPGASASSPLRLTLPPGLSTDLPFTPMAADGSKSTTGAPSPAKGTHRRRRATGRATASRAGSGSGSGSGAGAGAGAGAIAGRSPGAARSSSEASSLRAHLQAADSMFSTAGMPVYTAAGASTATAAAAAAPWTSHAGMLEWTAQSARAAVNAENDAVLDDHVLFRAGTPSTTSAAAAVAAAVAAAAAAAAANSLHGAVGSPSRSPVLMHHAQAVHPHEPFMFVGSAPAPPSSASTAVSAAASGAVAESAAPVLSGAGLGTSMRVEVPPHPALHHLGDTQSGAGSPLSVHLGSLQSRLRDSCTLGALSGTAPDVFVPPNLSMLDHTVMSSGSPHSSDDFTSVAPAASAAAVDGGGAVGALEPSHGVGAPPPHVNAPTHRVMYQNTMPAVSPVVRPNALPAGYDTWLDPVTAPASASASASASAPALAQPPPPPPPFHGNHGSAATAAEAAAAASPQLQVRHMGAAPVRHPAVDAVMTRGRSLSADDTRLQLGKGMHPTGAGSDLADFSFLDLDHDDAFAEFWG